jgi:hypothetical protein
MDNVAMALRLVPAVLAQYEKRDVFNFDETALFYLARLGKTLCQEASSGHKQDKHRVTAGLCCSIEGEKLPAVVINKALRPRCFGKTFRASDYQRLTPIGSAGQQVDKKAQQQLAVLGEQQQLVCVQGKQLGMLQIPWRCSEGMCESTVVTTSSGEVMWRGMVGFGLESCRELSKCSIDMYTPLACPK